MWFGANFPILFDCIILWEAPQGGRMIGSDGKLQNTSKSDDDLHQRINKELPLYYSYMV